MSFGFPSLGAGSFGGGFALPFRGLAGGIFGNFLRQALPFAAGQAAQGAAPDSPAAQRLATLAAGGYIGNGILQPVFNAATQPPPAGQSRSQAVQGAAQQSGEMALKTAALALPTIATLGLAAPAAAAAAGAAQAATAGAAGAAAAGTAAPSIAAAAPSAIQPVSSIAQGAGQAAQAAPQIVRAADITQAQGLLGQAADLGLGQAPGLQPAIQGARNTATPAPVQQFPPTFQPGVPGVPNEIVGPFAPGAGGVPPAPSPALSPVQAVQPAPPGAEILPPQQSLSEQFFGELQRQFPRQAARTANRQIEQGQQRQAQEQQQVQVAQAQQAQVNQAARATAIQPTQAGPSQGAALSQDPTAPPVPEVAQQAQQQEASQLSALGGPAAPSQIPQLDPRLFQQQPAPTIDLAALGLATPQTQQLAASGARQQVPSIDLASLLPGGALGSPQGRQDAFAQAQGAAIQNLFDPTAQPLPAAGEFSAAPALPKQTQGGGIFQGGLGDLFGSLFGGPDNGVGTLGLLAQGFAPQGSFGNVVGQRLQAAGQETKDAANLQAMIDQATQAAFAQLGIAPPGAPAGATAAQPSALGQGGGQAQSPFFPARARR